MARAFFGRICAYESGLSGDDAQLGAVLARNLYGTISEPASFAALITPYVRSAVQELRRQPVAELLAGSIIFGTPADVNLPSNISRAAEP
jgi:cytochrome b pre-mRNA-processing protein 3